jgi:hypothetical protein
MKGLDIDSSFNNAIVLIEPKQLREFPLMEIPVGEVPTISFNLLRGTRASFAKRQFFKDDQAFYYLVPAEMHDVLEIIAHRYYFRDDPIGRIDKLPKTNYDTVIENIVRSMEFH